MTKSIWQSKTFWFNVLSGTGTVLGAVSGLLPPPAMPFVAAASAIINVGLRLVTNSAISTAPQ